MRIWYDFRCNNWCVYGTISGVTIGHCLYPAKFTYLVGGAAVPSVIRLMFTSVVNVVVMVKVQYYFQYVFSLDRESDENRISETKCQYTWPES